MNNGLIWGLIGGTAIGGGIAAFITNKMVKEKYRTESEITLQKEIESVKKAFSDRNVRETVTEKESPKDIYTRVARENGYTKEEKPKAKPAIKVIPPEEYGEDKEYDQLSFTYYTGDKVVTNDKDKPMSESDICEFVGSREVLSHFGEYEDDSVFVKNEQNKSYIEILLFKGDYSDTLN